MKKKKVDILKNLNNLTPKLLRSLIELNDFNDISELVKPPPHYTPSHLVKPEVIAPHEFKKRKSSKSAHSHNQTQNINFIQEHGLLYSKMGSNLTSICPIGENILVAESVDKWTDYN
jgi:hypothetical protein